MFYSRYSLDFKDFFIHINDPVSLNNVSLSHETFGSPKYGTLIFSCRKKSNLKIKLVFDLIRSDQ